MVEPVLLIVLAVVILLGLRELVIRRAGRASDPAARRAAERLAAERRARWEARRDVRSSPGDGD